MPTACECKQPGLCQRHRCQKTEHWHKLCQTRKDYFQLWEAGRGPGQAQSVLAETSCSHSPIAMGQAPANPPSRHVRRNPSISRSIPWSNPKPVTRRVAVVVISHNYGHFLGECLESVLQQTAPPAEIIVIDDWSSDDTSTVARRFTRRGVRYQPVVCGNVHQARRAGFAATSADVLCFLDADDLLSPEYLAGGLPCFDDARVGVVYSDVRYFGTHSGQSLYPDQLDRQLLARDNYIHSGSLVLREALTLSRAFEREVDPLQTQADWFLWRRVLSDGWEARKQPAYYRYRHHDSNWTRAMRRQPLTYYDYAGLRHECVTLFIPLSGREALWRDLAAYLERQTWPRDQIRLILFDTSQDTAFSAKVRYWMAGGYYPDIRLIQTEVARPGLADESRRGAPHVQDAVRIAMARIYNRLAREAVTDYVWVLEDDILPPEDACERLLRGFDRETMSVSGVYNSRYDALPCVWDRNLQGMTRTGQGLQQVFGNGFGCVVLRGGYLRQTVFQATGDYDRVFYRQLNAAGFKAQVDWGLVCEHRSLPQRNRHAPNTLTSGHAPSATGAPTLNPQQTLAKSTASNGRHP